jgi:WD40 repeat protein
LRRRDVCRLGVVTVTGTWRTARVFISSTFRDMHAERDHLVKVSFPKLRQWCEERRLHLIDIDLRWGVTKEQAENRKAIDICLKEIDGSRPFFICILGNRYGWVPDELPPEDLYNFKRFFGSDEVSITHLEIIHAVFDPLEPRGAARGACCDHAFFYFRSPGCLFDPADLTGVSDAHRSAYKQTFFEQNDRRRRALSDLKDEISRRFGGEGRTYEYSGWWDSGAENPDDDSLKGRLTHLRDFGERVVADLKRAISIRFAEHIAGTGGDDPLTAERSLHETFIENRAHVHVPRIAVETELTRYVDSEDPRPLVVSGFPGSGKSSILAHWVTQHAGKPASSVLARFVGASPASTAIYPLLANLCTELAILAGRADTAGADGLDRAILTNPYELTRLWLELLEAAGQRGRVVVVIDAVNQLDEVAGKPRVDWVPRRLPSNVRMIFSAIDRGGGPAAGPLPAPDDSDDWLACLRRAGCPELPVPDLSPLERRLIIRELPSVFCKSLDDQQIDLLLENQATRNPLFLTVALNELRVFGAFDKLTPEIKGLPGIPEQAPPAGAVGGPAAQPGGGLSQPAPAGVMGEIEQALDEIFARVLFRLEKETGREAPGLVPALFRLIGSARNGLSEAELHGALALELEALPGAELSGSMQVILRQVRPYLMRKGMRRGALIDFFHQSFRSAVRNRYLGTCEARLRSHQALSDYFGAQPLYLDASPTESSPPAGPPPQGTSLTPNSRKLSELPWQLVHAILGFQEDARGLGSAAAAEVRQRLYDLLVDPHFWEARIADEDQGVHSLGDDLRRALGGGLGWEKGHEDVLRAVERVQATQAARLRAWPHLAATAVFRLLLVEEVGEGGPLRRAGRWMVDRWLPAHRRARWFHRLEELPGTLTLMERRRLLGHRGHITCCAPSADGRRLLSASHDGTVRLWDVESGRELIPPVDSPHAFLCCSMSEDARLGVAGSRDGRLVLLDLESGQLVQTLEGHCSPVVSCAFLGPDEVASAGGWDTAIFRWRVGRVGPVGEVLVPSMVCSAFAPAARLAATGTVDGRVTLWDLSTGAKRLDIPTARWATDSGWPLDWCGVSGDGRWLLTASGREVMFWQVATGGLVRSLTEYDGESSAGAFHPEEGVLLLGSRRGGFRMTLIRGEQLHDFYLRRGENQAERAPWGTTCCVASADGGTVFAGDENGCIRVWKPEEIMTRPELFPLMAYEGGQTGAHPGAAVKRWRTGPPVRHLDVELSPRLYQPSAGELLETTCAQSDDSRLGLVGYNHGLIRVLDMADGESLGKLRGHDGTVLNCSFLNEGTRVLSSAADGTLRLWDLGDFKEVRRYDKAPPSRWEFARDGTLAVSLGDATVYSWDLSTGEAVHSLTPRTGRATAVALSGDGTTALVGQDDGTLVAWQLRRDVPRESRWKSHAGAIRLCAISGDGATALTASQDGDVCCWSPADGGRISRLAADGRLVRYAQLSVGGERALILTADGTLTLWDVDDGTCLAFYDAEPPLRFAAGDGQLTAVFACDRRSAIHRLRAKEWAPVELLEPTTRGAQS